MNKLEWFGKLDTILKQAEQCQTPKEKEQIVAELTEFEFATQEFFGYKRDSNYHKYWLLLPGCTCPRMDNQDCWGVSIRYMSSTCPWHGIIEKGELV